MQNGTGVYIFLVSVFGMIAFMLVYTVTSNGLKMYRNYFVSRVDRGLKSLFLFKDANSLFLFHLAIVVTAIGMGYWYGDIVGLLIGLGITVALPSLVIQRLKKRRVNNFIYQLPDALNSISASLRAGTNLPRAIEQIADQQPEPMSQEFTVVLSEYKMGRKLEDSLGDMYQRINRPELDLLISAITISRSVGGNLADTLEILASTLREKAQIEGKIEALTAMGRMQGWVVGLIPLAVMFMLNKQEPEGMKALFTEPVGWLVLGIISFLMLIAIIMIRKIVNIDI